MQSGDYFFYFDYGILRLQQPGLQNKVAQGSVGLKRSKQAEKAQHNACTMCYKTTHFFWTFASPRNGLYKDIRSLKWPNLFCRSQFIQS